MIRTITAVILLILAPALPVLAQQDLAEELLRWFPQGTYMMIAHKDAGLLSQGKAWPLFKEFFDPDDMKDAEEKTGAKAENREKAAKPRLSIMRSPQMAPPALTPKLLGAVQSSTVADALEIADMPPGADDENSNFVMEMPEREAPASRGEENVRVGIFITRNLSLEVHRLTDPEMTIAAAIASAEIANTGRKIAGRPVYSFQSVRFGDRSEDRFAWLSPDGELLVAASPELLSKMVATGNGSMMGLVDDADYSELVQQIPDLGPQWNAMAIGRTGAQIAEKSENISDEQLKRMQERASKGPQMMISSWHVTDVITLRSITVYPSAEQAEKLQGEDMGGIPGGMGLGPEYDAYQQLLAQRRQTVVDGHLVIKSLVYDRELFTAEEKANEAMAAALAKNNGRLEMASPDGGKKIVIQMKGDVPPGKTTTKKKQQ